MGFFIILFQNVKTWAFFYYFLRFCSRRLQTRSQNVSILASTILHRSWVRRLSSRMPWRNTRHSWFIFISCSSLYVLYHILLRWGDVLGMSDRSMLSWTNHNMKLCVGSILRLQPEFLPKAHSPKSSSNSCFITGIDNRCTAWTCTIIFIYLLSKYISLPMKMSLNARCSPLQL